jgi:hypothetical protein
MSKNETEELLKIVELLKTQEYLLISEVERSTLLKFIPDLSMVEFIGFSKSTTEDKMGDSIQNYLIEKVIWTPKKTWVDSIQIIPTIEITKKDKNKLNDLVNELATIKNLYISSFDGMIDLESKSAKQFFNLFNSLEIKNLELSITSDTILNLHWITIPSNKFKMSVSEEAIINLNQSDGILKTPKEVELSFNIESITDTTLNLLLLQLNTTDLILNIYDKKVQHIESNYIIEIPTTIQKLVVNYDVYVYSRSFSGNANSFFYFKGCESIESLIINDRHVGEITINDNLGFCYFESLPKLQYLKLYRISSFPIGVKSLLKNKTQSIKTLILEYISIVDSVIGYPTDENIKNQLKDELKDKKNGEWSFNTLSTFLSYWKPEELNLNYCIYNDETLFDRLIPQNTLKVHHKMKLGLKTFHRENTFNLLDLYLTCERRQIKFEFLDDDNAPWDEILAFLRMARFLKIQ